MRTIALALSACVFLAPAAPAAEPPAASVSIATGAEVSVATITVTAPRLKAADARALRAVRAGGAGVAVGGVGLVAYAVIFEAAGPVGWAAGLIFFGGMAAYLSHRKLAGHDDLSPDESRRDAEKPSR